MVREVVAAVVGEAWQGWSDGEGGGEVGGGGGGGETTEAAAAIRAAKLAEYKRMAPVWKEQAIAREKAAAEQQEEQPAQTEQGDEPDARYWRKRLFATLNERGITDADEQRQGIGHIIGRDITSRSELAEDDARQVVEHLDSTGADQ